MEPRLLVRTHYQVNDLTYLELLLRQCAAPIRSTSKDRLARCLSDKTPIGMHLNITAAQYAVDMGQRLGLLSDNFAWATHGVYLGLTSDASHFDRSDFEQLSPTRRLAQCVVLMEGNGAAIWFLLKRARNTGELRPGGDEANELATEMYIELYRSYLELTSSFQDRVRLRTTMDALARKRYSGNTGRHKMLFHVNCMHRLGFLDRPDSKSLVFVLSETGRRATDTLESKINSIAALERNAAKDDLFGIAARLLLGDLTEVYISRERFEESLVEAYRAVVALGFSIVPITLLHKLMAHTFAMKGETLSRDALQQSLEELRHQKPRRLRFHVDRKGRPAYLIIDEQN